MKILKLLTVIGLFQCFPAFLFAQSGANLFWQNCASCHTIGKGKLVGPDLKGVMGKHSKAWLVQWIKSSQTLIKSGDKEAVQVFNDNNHIIMSDQDLTNDEIANILEYINTESGKVTATAAVTSNTQGSTPTTNPTGNSVAIWYVGIGVLLAIALALVILKTNRRKR